MTQSQTEAGFGKTDALLLLMALIWGINFSVVKYGTQVLTQLASVLIVLAYSGGATFVILKLLALVMPLRISVRDEKLGLDVSDHGEEAYTHGDGAILVKPKDRPVSQAATDIVAVSGGGGL